MTVSDEFLGFVLDQLAGWPGVSARRMFGGAGLYRGGIMVGLVAEDRTYLRVDDANRASFEAAGSEPFHPYGSSAKMPHYEVPADVIEDPESFRAWAEGALEAAARRARTPSGRRRSR
jgi:DNA transformation protein